MGNRRGGEGRQHRASGLEVPAAPLTGILSTPVPICAQVTSFPHSPSSVRLTPCQPRRPSWQHQHLRLKAASGPHWPAAPPHFPKFLASPDASPKPLPVTPGSLFCLIGALSPLVSFLLVFSFPPSWPQEKAALIHSSHYVVTPGPPSWVLHTHHLPQHPPRG